MKFNSNGALRIALARISLSVALLAASCSCATSLDQDDYDRTCTSDDDCVAVNTDKCSTCGSGTINKDSFAEFTSDYEELSDNCLFQGPLCIYAGDAACRDGLCVRDPEADTAEGEGE